MTLNEFFKKWWLPIVTLLAINAAVILAFESKRLNEVVASQLPKESASAPAPQPQLRSGPLMAWTGQSELGFTRAELWNSNDENYPHEFVILTSGKPEAVSNKVTLAAVPSGIGVTPGIVTLIVRAPRDRGYMTSNAGVLAVVDKAGSLRLFYIGAGQLLQACELTPDSRR